jgi:hypothetical protein
MPDSQSGKQGEGLLRGEWGEPREHRGASCLRRQTVWTDQVGRASRLPLSDAVPADFTSVERWFCSRADALLIPTPPTLRRWSGGFAPEQTRSSYRPRRLYVGGAVVLLQSRRAPHTAPADFTSVERWFCSRADALLIPSPPTLRRWSGGFAPEQTRSSYRPRRLYVGGAVVLLQSRRAPHTVPADFTSVERWFSFRFGTRDGDNVREGVNGRGEIRGKKRRVSITAPPT